MISIALPVLSLIAISAAQNSTVSLFIPGGDGLVGSVAGSDATATTYVVQCGSSTSSINSAQAAAYSTGIPFGSGVDSGVGTAQPLINDGCFFNGTMTVVQGPSTVHYAVSPLGGGVDSIDCKIEGSTKAVCTESASGPITTATAQGVSALPPLTTETISGTDFSQVPVIITAGAGASSAGVAKATGSGSSPGSSGPSSGSSGPSSTATSAAKQSTGGVMHVAPAVGGVMGAFGVALAGAML